MYTVIKRVQRPLLLLSVFCLALCGTAVAATPAQNEAVRINNIGVALMSQQLLEKAADRFDEAYKLDPSLAAAELNKAIALLYLQRLPEAAAALQHVAAQAPQNPRVWYVSGLLYRSENKPQESMAAFRKVLSLDPSNADSHYFLGSFLIDQQNHVAAEAEFRAALQLAPLHASALFGLARALQREGKTEEARATLKRFQQLTTAKLASPFSHNYGEEGALSRAEDAATNAPRVGPMIPVTFSRAWLSNAGTQNPGSTAPAAGACLIDLEGNGRASLVIMGHGESTVQLYRSTGDGGSEPGTSTVQGLA